MPSMAPPRPVVPSPTPRPRPEPRPRRRGVRWRLPRLLMAVLVLADLLAGTGAALLLGAPDSDPLAARVAEWARDHGMNGLVTGLESARYQLDRPGVGGEPAGGIRPAAGVVAGHEPVARPLAPVTGGAPLPGEGVWQTVVLARGGGAAVQTTSLRVDPDHTSFVAGVLRIDPRLVRGELHPGTDDPGGSGWAASTSLAGAAGAGVAAAFNGGFRLSDPSHNGYYSQGRTVTPLVDGRASLVLRADGTADVGAWGSEVRMGPDVASVRQNLVPLVDRGVVTPSCATGGVREWGSTIGQAAFVHRSGFGVTADGTEIYVGGPALSVCTLGRILADAGVVRGMELDINPNWVSGTYFHDVPHGPALGFRLFPDEQVGPDHYFSPSARDWYAWYLRP